MKVTYTFDDEDDGSRLIFESASRFYDALFEIADIIRSHQKYGDTKDLQEISRVFDAINEQLIISRYDDIP